MLISPGPAPAPPPPELDVAYPLTYYANTTDPDAATPLKLEEDTKAEIQLNLQPVPALHIAFGDIEKSPDQQIVPMLYQRAPGGGSSISKASR